MEALPGYPYRYVRTFCSDDTDDPYLLRKKLYSFDSPRTHRTYWVWVEVYEDHFYAVKFHLKEHRNSSRKYQLLTGLNEVRPIINTCILILKSIADEDSLSSFGFIGASSPGESTVDTKRFRVYRRLISTYFGDEVFEHYFFPHYSAYVMLRGSVARADSNAILRVGEHFFRMYDYFSG